LGQRETHSLQEVKGEYRQCKRKGLHQVKRKKAEGSRQGAWTGGGRGRRGGTDVVPRGKSWKSVGKAPHGEKEERTAKKEKART